MRGARPAGLLIVVLCLAGCGSDAVPGGPAAPPPTTESDVTMPAPVDPTVVASPDPAVVASPAPTDVAPVDPAVVASVEAVLDEADATAELAEGELADPLPTP